VNGSGSVTEVYATDVVKVLTLTVLLTEAADKVEQNSEITYGETTYTVINAELRSENTSFALYEIIAEA